MKSIEINIFVTEKMISTTIRIPEKGDDNERKTFCVFCVKERKKCLFEQR